jgi:Flp pilus assembly pilin Flp
MLGMSRRSRRFILWAVMRLGLFLVSASAATRHFVADRLRRADGVTSVEYAVIVLLCGVAIVAAVALLNEPVRTIFNREVSDLAVP